MKKRILVLTGSPRVGGNSDLMAEAFIKGATEVGHTVRRFDAGRHDIKPCRACDACFRTGKACAFDDDYNILAPMLFETDMLVIITPIYWYSFPAGIKAALDKLYSLIVGEKDVPIREAMLLACGEIKEERIFEGLSKSYSLILEDRGWSDCGQIIVPGVNKQGEILKTDALLKAEQAGRNIK